VITVHGNAPAGADDDDIAHVHRADRAWSDVRPRLPLRLGLADLDGLREQIEQLANGAAAAADRHTLDDLRNQNE